MKVSCPKIEKQDLCNLNVEWIVVKSSIFSYVVGNVGPELPQSEKQIMFYRKIVGKICILETPFLNTN